MQSTGTGRTAGGVHKTPVNQNESTKSPGFRGRGRGTAYLSQPPGLAFHSKTVAPSEVAAASHLARQMAKTTLEKSSDPVSSGDGQFSPAPESSQPYLSAEPVVRKTGTPPQSRPETSTPGSQACPPPLAVPKGEQYTLEWELVDAKDQLDKDLATLSDPEERCLRIASEINRFKKRQEIRHNEWTKHKINDFIRPYYARELVSYLNHLRAEVSQCRGQGRHKTFLKVIAHANLLNRGELDYTPDEYVDKVAAVLREWIQVELNYLSFRENWSDKRGTEWSLTCVRWLLSENEPSVYLGILGRDEIELYRDEFLSIEAGLKCNSTHRVIANSELVQCMDRGDLQECDRLLWKERHPDPFFQRMLGDLLSRSMDESNDEFSTREGRTIEQAIGFLKTLFLFSRDYAQSYAHIPKLERRMFNLLSAVVYELLTKCQAQRNAGYTLDPIVISIIATLVDQEWLDDDCCKLWQAHNAPELKLEPDLVGQRQAENV